MTFILEVIGTVTFAFAGALVAIDNDLDWLGINLMAVCTACGGGMTRDIILGNTPPMMFRNPVYVLIAVASAFITIAIYKPLIKSRYKNDILFIINTLDAVGLAIFTIVGMQIASNVGFSDNGFLVCFVGVLSAVGGGLLRDIMVNRTPVILQKEIYATASMAGSLIYYFSWGFMDDIVGSGIAMVLIFGIRMWALRKNVNLPYVKKSEEKK
ncbi:MAG: trimeric intracellular cation channel family protein [Oscillospiraceae bacterium]